MQKKRPFRSYLKILVFSSKCWFFWTYGQKQFFQRDLKKSNFSLNFDIFEDMEKKITFSKWSQNNFIFLEMLIRTDLWTKLFLISKNVVYSEILIFTETCIFAIRSQRTSLLSKCWLFRIYGQKTMFRTDVKIT